MELAALPAAAGQPVPASRRPRIHLYTMGWNEERLLPYFFRHYDRWVDRYVIYDDSSTDATLDMLHSHPRVEVRPFVRCVADSFVLSAQAIHNSCWKESRGAADWVIVTAIDEHLYHPDFDDYLRACERDGVTAIPALGFDMVSDTFPQGEQHLCEQVLLGEPTAGMSKLSLFKPDSLIETRYAEGRHSAQPEGNVRYPESDSLLNLHFKTLGLDYYITRCRLLATGLGPRDRANRWGWHYEGSTAQMTARYTACQTGAYAVIGAGARAAKEHREPRWWRPDVVGPHGGAAAQSLSRPLAGPGEWRAPLRLARCIYRYLPLPQSTRLRLKDAFFRACGSVLHDTSAYRDWASWVARGKRAGSIAGTVDVWPDARSVLAIPRIACETLATKPYAWAAIAPIFEPEDAAALAASFPRDEFKTVVGHDGEKGYEYAARSLIHMGAHVATHPAGLSAEWRQLAADVLSPAYRAAMMRLTGLDLTATMIEANITEYGPDAWLGSHVDLREKLVTHVMYFNTEWNRDDGGCLGILRSADPAAVAHEVIPVVGNSVVLVRSDRSWHTVGRVRRAVRGVNRRALNVIFHLPGSISTMWPPPQSAGRAWLAATRHRIKALW